MATPIPENRAEFTSSEVAAATGGDLVMAAATRPARGFVTDSRAVTPGSAFVALEGANFDGHAFVGDAIARGASLVVVRRGARVRPGASLDVVEVPDTLRAWGDIARAHLRRWRRGGRDLATVAITGSAGKTTTKELCAALLSAVGPCHSTTGNLNNRIGVPAVALGVAPTTRFGVFEVGMSEPGEIAELARVVESDVAILVNVGVAHAGGVGGTRAHVAHEKGALVEAVDPDGTVVLNRDDDAAFGQATRCRAAIVTFGRDDGAEYRLLDRAALGDRGSRVEVSRPGDAFAVTLPLLGESAALDFVAALAAADAAAGGPLPVPTIERALRDCRPTAGRAKLMRLGGDVLAIDDTYNANPASMLAALETLREVARGIASASTPTARRQVAVLGEMRELGSLAEDAHDTLGEALARAGVALAIGCGGLVDRALDRAASLGVRVEHARSTPEAAEIACREVRPGDVVLLKGSRAAAVETVLQALERELARP